MRRRALRLLATDTTAICAAAGWTGASGTMEHHSPLSVSKQCHPSWGRRIALLQDQGVSDDQFAVETATTLVS
jgi:hypothetical protein